VARDAHAPRRLAVAALGARHRCRQRRRRRADERRGPPRAAVRANEVLHARVRRERRRARRAARQDQDIGRGFGGERRGVRHDADVPRAAGCVVRGVVLFGGVWGRRVVGLRRVGVFEVHAAGLGVDAGPHEDVVRCHELGFFAAVGEEDECGGHGGIGRLEGVWW